MDYRLAAQLEPLDEMGIKLRRLILTAVASSGRGHIGPSMSILEVISTLYNDIMQHRPKEPDWNERDVFLLSKGHGCLALYAVLAQQGYFPIAELKTFCEFNSRLGGHPEWHSLPGVEFSTGSLGHGLAVAVGIAKAFKLKGSTQRVFVVLGDGELGEGSIWESAMHASKHSLSNLFVIVDFNSMQAYGKLDAVLPLGDLNLKLKAFGFNVIEINGHARNDILRLKGISKDINMPTAVIAHTIKGKGISVAENAIEWHHKAKITDSEVTKMLAGLN